jgi:hypothetical protein
MNAHIKLLWDTRPTGEDKHYYERMPWKHIAWEFLRRNPKYQLACALAVSNGQGEEGGPPGEYMRKPPLKNIVDFRRDYGGAQGDIEFISRARNVEAKPMTAEVSDRYFVFPTVDLLAIVKNPRLLDLRKKQYADELTKSYMEFKKKNPGLKRAPERPRREILMRLLRLLDLEAAGELPDDIARILWRDYYRGKRNVAYDDHDAKKLFYRDKKQAHAIRDRGIASVAGVLAGSLR